jgi:peptidoglycan/xylan/chitin deacetylase (PgdA/CDA1 family)
VLAEPFGPVRALGNQQLEMTMAITFDDGPDPVWTPRLLDLLGRLGARVTFFPIAPRAAAQPELIARMLAEGHAIGLHCEEHVRHSSREIDWVRRDTARALERLSALGVTPSLWRTPWGDLAPWSGAIAAEFGLRIVRWTVDTHDWRGDTAAYMFTASRGSLRDQAIVLAHDGIGPGARRADVEQTLEFVTLAATDAGRRGLKLEALA